MKNNKGYYNWIHSMKNAAMESHLKGCEMINEANEKKDVSKTTPKTIKTAGGDPSVYVEIRRAKHAEKLKQLKDMKPTDVDGSGYVDAFDVEEKNAEDAADGVQDTKVGPNFTNPIAAQARIETGNAVSGDEKLAAKLSDEEHDEEDEDYWRREMMPSEHTVMGESVNQKISRMLKESQRGKIVKGDDAQLASPGLPTSAGAPADMFHFNASPEEKLGTILGIVRDGPKKHGSEKYEWATAALNAMQKTLRKG
jgi:hypothetical protein